MSTGSKPGKRRGGRAAGVPNKATAEVKALAGQYAPAAIKELGRLSIHAESEAARVSAIKELLDRAYGKPQQSIDLDLEHNAKGPFKVILDWIDGTSRELPVKPTV